MLLENLLQKSNQSHIKMSYGYTGFIFNKFGIKIIIFLFQKFHRFIKFLIQTDNQQSHYKKFQTVEENHIMGQVASESIKKSSVHKEQYDNFVLTYGETQGLRNTMQDTLISVPQFSHNQSLFAVFDGHGGSGVSQLLRDQFQRYFCNQLNLKPNNISQALIDTLKSIDQFILSQKGNQSLSKMMQARGNFYETGDDHIAGRMGSTANIVFLSANKIYTANVGDSKAVLCRNGKGIALSIDHKPYLPLEKQRIQKLGFSTDGGRINGGLNLSRSLGDAEYKQTVSLPYDHQAVICKPDIKQISRNQNDQFLLIGTDGIWERYDDEAGQKLIDYVSKLIKEGMQADKILEKMFKMLKAKSRSQPVGCDNMAAILIIFK